MPPPPYTPWWPSSRTWLQRLLGRGVDMWSCGIFWSSRSFHTKITLNAKILFTGTDFQKLENYLFFIYWMLKFIGMTNKLFFQYYPCHHLAAAKVAWWVGITGLVRTTCNRIAYSALKVVEWEVWRELGNPNQWCSLLN